MKYRDSDSAFPWDIAILFNPVAILVGAFVALMVECGPIMLSVSWAAVLAVVVGGVKVFYAKLPLYRQGRFFTLGFHSVPACLQPLYRSGWRWIGIGGAVAALLLTQLVLR